MKKKKIFALAFALLLIFSSVATLLAYNSCPNHPNATPICCDGFNANDDPGAPLYRHMLKCPECDTYLDEEDCVFYMESPGVVKCVCGLTLYIYE